MQTIGGVAGGRVENPHTKHRALYKFVKQEKVSWMEFTFEKL